MSRKEASEGVVYHVDTYWWKNKPPKWEYPEDLPAPPPGMNLPPGLVYTGDPILPVLPYTPPPAKRKRGDRMWPPSDKIKLVELAELVRAEFFPEFKGKGFAALPPNIQLELARRKLPAYVPVPKIQGTVRDIGNGTIVLNATLEEMFDDYEQQRTLRDGLRIR